MKRLPSRAAVLWTGIVLTAGAADSLVLNDGDDIVYGAETVAVGGITYPCKVGTVPAHASLTLNGTTLSCTSLNASNNSNYGSDSDLVLNDGAAMTVSGNIFYGASSYGDRSRARLRATDSSFTVPSGGYISFGFGANDLNQGYFGFFGTNSQFRFTSGTAFNLFGRCDVDLERSVFTTAGTANMGTIGSAAASGSIRGFTNDFRFVSSTVTCGNSLTMCGALASDVLISDTALTVSSGSLSIGGGSAYTLAKAPTCFDVNVAVTNGSSLTVYSNFSIAGTSVGTTRLAVSRDSSLTLGGTFSVAAYGTGIVHAAGASITASGGVSLGSGAKSCASLDIGDGTLATKSVTGGSGESTLSVDGATIRLVADGGSLFNKITTLSIGPKGLTVDMDGHTATLCKTIVADGPVLFTGAGTLTVAAGVSVDACDVSGCAKIVWTDAGESVTNTVTAAGIEVRSDAISFDGSDTRVFDIASGAGLELTGPVGVGKVEKTGGGLLLLNNSEDRFLGGFVLTGGTLAFGPNAPAKFGAPFTIGNTTSKALTVIRADRDVTMDFPLNYSTSWKGAFMKRGTGHLVMERRVGWMAYTDTSAPDSPSTLDPDSPIDFGDGTVLPTDNYVNFSVTEGRLTLRGITATPAGYRFQAYHVVGTPVTSCAAQPELVIENLQPDLTESYVGAGLGADSPVVAPKLFLLNAYHGGKIYANYNTTGGIALRPYIYASNSTVKAEQSVLNGVPADTKPSSSAARATWRFVAGSVFRATTRIGYKHPTTLEFDHSTLCGETVSTPVALYGEKYCDTNTTVFANGSRFCFANAVSTPSSGIKISARQTFILDNSTMDPLTTEDFTYDIDTVHFNVYFVMRGRGMILAPVAGQTITMTEKLHGAGGFVNGGAGRVVLEDGTVDYAGLTSVTNEAAVIDFDGASLTNALLAGAGVFTNATFETPTLVVTATGAAATDAPQFAAETAFSGRVRVDLQDPDGYLVKTAGVYPAVPVASYTGTAPDVSKWRIKRGERFSKGTFAASAGVVTCVPQDRTGLMLILK